MVVFVRFMCEKVCLYVVKKSKFFRHVCLVNKRSSSFVHHASMTFLMIVITEYILRFVSKAFVQKPAMNIDKRELPMFVRHYSIKSKILQIWQGYSVLGDPEELRNKR